MASFDIVSEVDLQEVDNAINQARKELQSRYDLRGSRCEIQWDKKEMVLQGDDEYKIGAVKDVLQTKLHKRGIDLQSIKFTDPEPAGQLLLKQKATLVQGIEKDIAKKIIAAIKEAKLKVQAQIQDEQVRVTSKSIDELQSCIALCRSQAFGVPLQFVNMRS